MSFAAGPAGEAAASCSGTRWLLKLESGPVNGTVSSRKPCCFPDSRARPSPLRARGRPCLRGAAAAWRRPWFLHSVVGFGGIGFAELKRFIAVTHL